jgi:hypothetical protein
MVTLKGNFMGVKELKTRSQHRKGRIHEKNENHE